MTSKPGQNIYIDVLPYLGAGIRNGAIPIGHPKLRGYLKLSMTTELQQLIPYLESSYAIPVALLVGSCWGLFG